MIRPLFPWIGGKNKELKYLDKTILPKKYNKYYEPFFRRYYLLFNFLTYINNF